MVDDNAFGLRVAGSDRLVPTTRCERERVRETSCVPSEETPSHDAMERAREREREKERERETGFGC